MTEPAARAETIIEPSRGFLPLDLRALWQHRELIYFLGLRDIQVRYKQTALGMVWALLQPLLSMVVFTIFFGRLAGVPSDGVPYPLFVYAGLLPWMFFSNGMVQVANSLVANQGLITKVYFPRLVVPLAALASPLVDLAVASLLLPYLLLRYGHAPGWGLLWTPLLLLFGVGAALGVGLWLAALNARYRDVRHALPFLAQVWLFATPIAYPSSLVPEQYRGLYALNPMVGVVDGFRWAALGTPAAPQVLASSAAVTGLLLAGGAFYFRRMEREFVDVA